uniref:MRH domain-containing protein n=1 Tax=Romanomermis culicivorax TaxID=13658 RepID=A0A915JKQ0_ROMCU
AYWDDSKSSSTSEALACRFVAVPEQKKVRYLGTSKIGDYLFGVSDDLSFVDMEISNNDSFKWRYSQLFFLYRDSSGKTKNCPQGRNTILTFRCDPAKNETKVELPSSCPDGTCDGCLFHIIITSRFACPVCLEADYIRILGECRLGRQTVHYVPAEHCVFAGQNSMETKVIQCRFLPIEVQIAIGLTLSIALILLISLARVWKKNKRLEYKYMKLIESSGKSGELPAVESCALHEGDEEDEDENNVDRVVFTKGKANKWFNKGKFSSSHPNNSRVVDCTGSENRALTADNDD